MLHRDHLAASVVCFHPDRDVLARLLRVLSASCRTVFVINNGGLEACDGELSALASNIRLIHPGTNIGMASALNLGFRLAESEGLSHLITFDQDSTPTGPALRALVAAFDTLVRRGAKAGAVGPGFFDPRSAHLLESAPPGEPLARSFIITSGCLASIEAWQASGGFDDRLFIDLVDVEWCWRLAECGYGVFLAPDAVMEHRLSDGIRLKLGRYRFNSYPPIRRYYIARNACRLLASRLRRRDQAGFLLKTFFYSLACAVVSDTNKLQSLKAVVCGCIHACRGRMGKHDLETKK